MDVASYKAIYEEQLAAVNGQRDEAKTVRDAAGRVLRLALLLSGATVLTGGLGSLAWVVAVLLGLSVLLSMYIWMPTKPEPAEGAGKRGVGRLLQWWRKLRRKLLGPKGWTWWIDGKQALHLHKTDTETSFYRRRTLDLREAFETNQARLDRLQRSLEALMATVVALVVILVLTGT